MTKILSNKSNIDLDYPICRPSLDLDFTQEVLDPRITFSRGSIGTRVNRNRLIETVSANQPRFDYDPVTGECKGLLIEETRSNYFWGTQTGNGGTVSNGTAIGADGVTAKKFVPTLGNTSFPSIASRTDYTIPVGSQVTGGTVDISFSGYFASLGNDLYTPDIVIQFTTGGTTNYIYAELLPNLTNGTVLQKSGIGVNGVSELISPQITLMPFGMYKVTWSVRYTQGATIRDTVGFYFQCRRKNSPSGATGTYYADGVNGFQFSCIQYEIGAFPTSYIPTTTSAVTRSADNASMTGTNFSSWYNSSEGTVYTKANSNNLANGGVIFIASNASYSERYAQLGLTGNVGYGYGATWNTNNSVIGGGAYTLVGDTYANGAYKKIAVSGIAGNFNGVSGNQILSSKKTNLYPSGITQARIGSYNNNVSYLNGTISRLTYYPRALKPNQLQYLTQ